MMNTKAYGHSKRSIGYLLTPRVVFAEACLGVSLDGELDVVPASRHVENIGIRPKKAMMRTLMKTPVRYREQIIL